MRRYRKQHIYVACDGVLTTYDDKAGRSCGYRGKNAAVPIPDGDSSCVMLGGRSSSAWIRAASLHLSSSAARVSGSCTMQLPPVQDLPMEELALGLPSVSADVQPSTLEDMADPHKRPRRLKFLIGQVAAGKGKSVMNKIEVMTIHRIVI